MAQSLKGRIIYGFGQATLVRISSVDKRLLFISMTKSNASAADPVMSFTLRKAPYSYFRISLRSLSATPQPPDELDEVSTRTYLTLALQQYLGLTGTAISIDILKVEGRDAWIRVPSEDEIAVAASLSQWTGTKDIAWRIEQRGAWLGGLAGNKDVRKLWTMDS